MSRMTSSPGHVALIKYLLAQKLVMLVRSGLTLGFADHVTSCRINM